MNKEIDIKRVQNKLFEMGKTISGILEKHGIPYMIAYGTLLGAVRHQDFIPWDDDFDFFLFNDSYDDAIECLRNELPNDMFVEDEKSEPLYFHAWAHVKDLNSETYCELFPQNNSYAHKGICIDLFKTGKLEKSQIEEFLENENRAYLNRRKDKGLISEKEYITRITKPIRTKSSTEENDDLMVYAFVSPYECHYMRSECVFPLKKYMIRDVEFYGPNNADKILRDIYGDYMQLPPKEKRKGHYSSVHFLK